MNKHSKGEYGYMKSYRRGKLIASIILAAMIAFVVISILIMYGSRNRVIIVFAVLLSLPFAKFFIAYIMCIRFKPLNTENYDHIVDKTSKDGDVKLLYDVVITKYEGMKFYQSICVKNGKVYALVIDDKITVNKKDYAKWIEECVADSKHKYSVSIICDTEEYIKKVNSISSPNDNTRLIDKHMKERILTTCV